MYTDEDTCSFVREQKHQQYRDLKHALQVMGRIEHPGSSSSSGGSQHRKTSGGQSLLTTRVSPALQASSPQSHLMLSSRGQLSPSLRPHSAVTPNFGGGFKKSMAMLAGSVSSKCSLLPEPMVLMYLLENNRLLLSSVNQMKLEAQVSLRHSAPPPSTQKIHTIL